jgi:hypothetical protein
VDSAPLQRRPGRLSSLSRLLFSTHWPCSGTSHPLSCGQCWSFASHADISLSKKSDSGAFLHGLPNLLSPDACVSTELRPNCDKSDRVCLSAG